MKLGSLISSALSIVGVTEERVSHWIGGPCGCEERKEKLDQLGLWAKRVVKGQTEKALVYLESIMAPLMKEQ